MINADREAFFSSLEKRRRINADGDHVESGSTSALHSANPFGTVASINSNIQESSRTTKLSSVCKTMPPSPMPLQQLSSTPCLISTPAELQGLAVSQQKNVILGKLMKEDLGAMAINSGLQATFFTRLLWDQFKQLEAVDSLTASVLEAAKKRIIDLENQLGRQTDELQAANQQKIAEQEEAKKRVIDLENQIGTQSEELEAAKQRITELEEAKKIIIDLENQLGTRVDEVETAKLSINELEKRLRHERIWNQYREAQLYMKYEDDLHAIDVELKAEKAKNLRRALSRKML